jgi:uncharacterized repeat protein (TIGR02543 family)
MKKRSSFWPALAPAALAVMLLFSACDQATGPDTEPEAVKDSPADRTMTAQTADAVFGKDGWKDIAIGGKSGVEILQFKDADALKAYLGAAPQASQRQAAEEAEGPALKLGTINGKPVIRIADRAFAYKPADGRGDITSVITRVELPGTIEELGGNLFEGVQTNTVAIDIPQDAPVLVKIVEQKVAEAKEALGGGATEEEILEAVAKAKEEAVEVITAKLQETAGKEAGVVIIEAPAPDPSVPAEDAPMLPPITGGVVDKPVELPPAPNPNPNPDPGPPSDPPAPAVITYKVTYNGNGGTGTLKDANRYASGRETTVLHNNNAFQRTGYRFTGWSTASQPGSGTSYAEGASITITGNITLYAQWIAVYTVTYNGNGSDGGSAPAATSHDAGTGGSITVTVAGVGSLTKTGHTFAGWNTKTDGNGMDYAPGDHSIPGSITLYAKWTPDTYTVTYNANYTGGGTASGTYQYGQEAKVSNTITFSRTYYVFTAWNTQANGTGNSYLPEDLIKGADVNKDLTLYAQWAVDTETPAIDVTNNNDSNTEGSLAKAIIDVKTRPEGIRIIQLTEGFYTEANSGSSAIVIDPGAGNETPYTIKGLGGKDPTTDKVLNVGILLANDYVTLKDVKIVVSDRNKAAITGSGSYKAAVSISRSSNGSGILTGNDQANNHVTVQNCDITFNSPTTLGNMAAGIFVSGDSSAPSTPPSDIVIDNNNVTVTNEINAATQAIAFRRTGSSFTLTSNVLTASNTPGGNSTDTPASALLLAMDAFTTPPTIEYNELRGEEFDFYINLSSMGSKAGHSGLTSKNFGTANSTWVTSTDNNSHVYKLLLNKLLEQAKGPALDGTGAQTFGRFAQYLGETVGVASGALALEYYEIDGGKITAVNYWSPGITGNLYNDGGPTSETDSDTGGIRSRFTIDNEGAITPAGPFHWTRTNTGSDLPPNP